MSILTETLCSGIFRASRQECSLTLVKHRRVSKKRMFVLSTELIIKGKLATVKRFEYGRFKR